MFISLFDQQERSQPVLRIPHAHNSSAQVIAKKIFVKRLRLCCQTVCKVKSKKGFASTCRTMISFPDLSRLVIVVPLLRSNWSQIINVSSFLLTYVQLSMSGRQELFSIVTSILAFSNGDKKNK